MLFVILAKYIFYSFSFTLSFINLPSFPDDVMRGMDYFSELLYAGIALYRYFMPTKLIGTLLSLYLAVCAFEFLYYLIMWACGKIPLANIH